MEALRAESHRANALVEHLGLVERLLDGNIRQALIEARHDLVEGGWIFFARQRVESGAHNLAIIAFGKNECIKCLGHSFLIGSHRNARVGIRRDQQRADGARVDKSPTETLWGINSVKCSNDTTRLKEVAFLPIGEIVSTIRDHVQCSR